jgi:GT2 family glycosyltransferase
MPKIAILVVSHNNPELTNKLCEDIISRTKVDYDLHVIETGSNLAKVSKYMTLWVNEGVRMTRGFNLAKQYADFTAAQKGYSYDAYHLFVNDAHYIDEQDMTGVLYEEMMKNSDCGQINPYQQNIYFPHTRQGKVNENGARKESFSEIICPLIRAEAWNQIPDLLDNVFFYGWGLDYDIPHKMHTNGWRIYISDTVGVHHQAFTSYREKEKTEEKMEVGQFVNSARQNMNEGFIKKYGQNWRRAIYDSIPEDVSKECMWLWLHHNDGFTL